MITLDALAALFDSEAMGQPYGEAISIRDHMLQCAERAVAQGLPDAQIAAALLHDIGWGAGGEAVGHETLGADLVASLFGPAVAEPIRLHVAAKRYLVATRPRYEACLSACSRETLARQGGPFSPAECAAFAALPGFAAAIAVRLLDDAGKELRAPVTQFANYLPLLQRLLPRMP